MIIGLIRNGRPTVMRRLLIRSKRRVLIASDYLERALRLLPCGHGQLGRELVAIDRARFGKVSCGHGLKSGGVHDCYTFQCGLVGSFASPGIDTRYRRDRGLLVSPPKDTGQAV